ncbi:MAG: gliding motility-associated C-terminal domain-containing protein [Bacteroidia bacterium]|nr:gliding motility-associated C-terminal domain-containing protein [Bacteroidia bacterium]
MVDNCGRVYVSGWGGGSNQSYHNGVDNVFGMPTTADAFQKTTDGSDFYLMVLSPNFENLLYASFYGGGQSQEHVDGGTSHFDKSGIVYQAACAGCGGLNDFPTTSNAYSRTNPGKRAFNTDIGGCNLGMFKFDMRTYVSPPVMRDTLLRVYAGQPLSYPFNITDAGGDKLSVTVNSAIIDSTANSAKINILQDLPGLIRAELLWNTRCEDYGKDTFLVEVRITDNACPVSNETTARIKILLLSDPIPPPYPECIKILNDTTLELKWVNNNPSSDFLQYQILRKKSTGSFEPFDSLLNQNATTYIDIKAADNLTENYCFMLFTQNSCRLPGDTSRFICSLPENENDTTQYFDGIEDEFFVIHAFDTFNGSFFIRSKNPLDSLFIKLSGDFVDKNIGTLSFVNGVGLGFAGIKWIPGCEFIGSDTLELLIQVRDNNCPNFRQALKRIKIIVIPMIQAKSPSIFCPKKFNSDTVLLEWSAFNARALTQELWLIRYVNNVIDNSIKLTSLNQTSVFDNITIDETKKVCYSLTSKDFCGYWGDTSVKACVQGKDTPAPDLLIYTATVVDDKEINLVWEQAQADSFWRYEVWKKEGRFSSRYELLASLNNVLDTQITDQDVKVDEQSYCYKIVNIDLCGNESVINKEACTILLKGSVEPFINKFNWLPYDYWMQGTNRYEILKTEPGIYQEQLFGSKSDKTLMAIDDKLNYDNGLYQYTIEAYESTFGNNQKSRSNTIDLVQSPLLHIPNAYTENNDGLNDNFQTVPVFVKDYYIQIYNRWGERIFESKNKKESFNGTYKKVEVENEVYFYIVTYTGWDGSSYTRKGNFTILR